MSGCAQSHLCQYLTLPFPLHQCLAHRTLRCIPPICLSITLIQNRVAVNLKPSLGTHLIPFHSVLLHSFPCQSIPFPSSPFWSCVSASYTTALFKSASAGGTSRQTELFLGTLLCPHSTAAVLCSKEVRGPLCLHCCRVYLYYWG